MKNKTNKGIIERFEKEFSEDPCVCKAGFKQFLIKALAQQNQATTKELQKVVLELRKRLDYWGADKIIKVIKKINIL